MRNWHRALIQCRAGSASAFWLSKRILINCRLIVGNFSKPAGEIVLTFSLINVVAGKPQRQRKTSVDLLNKTVTQYVPT